MTDQTKVPEAQDLSAEQVASYLRQHPEFFIQHEYLLSELSIPHASGAAISLGERQVQLFREHRDDLRAQLQELIAIANENDQHFETSKRLLLNLLEIKTLDEVEMVVHEVFKDDKNVDFSSVVLFGEQSDYPSSHVKLLTETQARDKLGALSDSAKAVCGQFTQDQLECLFGANAEHVASAAVIPLRNGGTLGMFCLGSRDSEHFDSSMGSLFLSYISDFISRILPELLLRSRSSQNVQAVPTLLE